MTRDVSERRQSVRHARPEDHGIANARVHPGKRVQIINVSAGGVLVESRHRLLPGAEINVHLEREHQRLVARGRLLRCYVSTLTAHCVCYRAAVAFDAPLQWLAQELSGESVSRDNAGRVEPSQSFCACGDCGAQATRGAGPGGTQARELA